MVQIVHLSQRFRSPVHLVLLTLLIGGVPSGAIAQTTPSSPPEAGQASIPDSSTAIQQVVTAGLMSPDANGNFQAERFLSRAELASILVKTFQLEKRVPQQAAIALQDVPRSHWAYNDIQTVLKTKIMQGYRAGMFHPNQRVTRAEALAIFGQAYGVFQLPQETIDKILNAYPDAKQAPSWSYRALATVLNEGFVNTDNQGNILPLQPMTRGDFAYTLSQYLARQQEGAAPVRLEDLVAPPPGGR